MRDTVVVTGAAGGIGAAVVRRLGQNCDVVATDLSPAVHELASHSVRPVVADLTFHEARGDVMDAVGSRRLTGVVNLAGITRDALIGNLAEEDVRIVLRVNAIAPIHLALELGERIVDGGVILFVSSRSHLGNIGQVNYSASKGAVVGATQALARRLAPRVRVNAIAPGLIRTPMKAAMPTHVLDKLVARIPLGRIGEPEDVAAEIAHQLSSDASYVTGQTLYVCGGRSL
jgi:NAD(P)-dependent dehydrogenase (short-subunit alcohol dehydrogenase family)